MLTCWRVRGKPSKIKPLLPLAPLSSAASESRWCRSCKVCVGGGDVCVFVRYACVCACACTCIGMLACAHVRVCIYVSVHVCSCMCTCIRMRGCVRVRICVHPYSGAPWFYPDSFKQMLAHLKYDVIWH